MCSEAAIRMRASLPPCSVDSFPRQRGIPVRLLCLLELKTSHVQMLDVALSLLKKLL